MLKDRVVVAALVGWLFVGMLAAAPQFVQGPSARWDHCTAFDAQRGVTVLFGGFAGGGVAGAGGSSPLADLWEWNGSTWIDRTPSALPPSWPAARGEAAMVYDSARGVCVLFGGSSANSSAGTYSDTWEWDGVTWVQRTGVGSPGKRHSHAMAYDSVRQRVVMQGGSNQFNWFAQIWEYDGTSWLNVTPATGPQPSARLYHAMAYSDAWGEVVIFGGRDNSGSPVNLNDLWSWDGAAWVNRTPSSLPSNWPAARSWNDLVYDSAHGKLVLTGGASDFTSLSSFGTWTLDMTSQSWTQVAPASDLPARSLSASAFDSVRGVTVLFGGITTPNSGGLLGDTWGFDGVQWRPKLDYVTSPCNGHRYALTPLMTWQEAEQLAVVEGGHLATVRSQVEQGWLWNAFGGSEPLLIGLSDAAIEGHWVWSSGESVAYTNWRTGAPDNHLGVQHWAHLSPQHAGQWDDGVAGPYKAIIEIPQSVAASAIAYGTGCGSPALAMTPSALPLVGSVASATISNAPSLFGGVSLGTSNTYTFPLPLPFELSIAGMPGCYLLQSNEVTGLPVSPSANPSTLSFNAPVPCRHELLGQQFYIQAYVIAPGANATQVVTSNGIEWTIGNN